MKQVVLTFVFAREGSLMVGMGDAEARQILNGWLLGTLKERIGDEKCPNPWGVRIADVCSVQIHDVATVQAAQQQTAQQQQAVTVPPGMNPAGYQRR